MLLYSHMRHSCCYVVSLRKLLDAAVKDATVQPHEALLLLQCLDLAVAVAVALSLTTIAAAGGLLP